MQILPISRWRTHRVVVGTIGIGGSEPIRIQSMTNTDTMDTRATVEQTVQLVDAGCELVRVTAPSVRAAAALGPICEELRKRGVSVPIAADIHFLPEAAHEAARHVEKVRINPGNYADRKKNIVREYSAEEYAGEIARIEERFTPLVLQCKEAGVAMRVGTNHGSLSDRIMNRYGDTPLGMVESALEFLRVCDRHGYRDVVLSMKASSTKIMVAAYRMLRDRMTEEGWTYPLHLGVTEAGDGRDGRAKSAVGIGALLLDGLGDTIRVSLTEDPVAEIPVAEKIVRICGAEGNLLELGVSGPRSYGINQHTDYQYCQRPCREVIWQGVRFGGGQVPRVVLGTSTEELGACRQLHGGDTPVELLMEHPAGSVGGDLMQAMPVIDLQTWEKCETGAIPAMVKVQLDELVGLSQRLCGIAGIRQRSAIFSVEGSLALEAGLISAHCGLASELDRAADSLNCKNWPILITDSWGDACEDAETGVLGAASRLGKLLLDGIGDAVWVRNPVFSPAEAVELAYDILQAAGLRVFKAEYVACPSCGRTMFNLEKTTARIRSRTKHLKGIKIAIMGCIVNGPGEMADADFGYVGSGPGRVQLFVGKECVERAVPEAEAEDRLVALIRKRGKWVDPDPVSL